MLKLRLASGFIIGLCTLCLFFMPPIVWNVVIFVLSLMAMKEMVLVIKSDKIKYVPISFILYFSTIYLIFNRGLKDVFDYKLLILYLFVVFTAMLFVTVFSNNKIKFTDVSINFFSIFYIVGFFSFVLFTRYLDETSVLGSIYTLLIFLSAWATDVGAFVFGITFGKHKIPSKISPKKTVEGVLGGIIFSVIVNILYCVILNKCFDLSLSVLIFGIFGILVSIVSQIGDFVASAIKRTVEIKDFSDLIPEHGGIIDRFDSVLLVAPCVYVFISLFVI